MFITVPHLYQEEYYNKTLNWLSLDSEERYNENLTSCPELLKRFNWIDSKIDYTFNSYGFRSDEFNLDPSVMFLGCSHTFGIGLPLENTFPHLVSKQLGLKNFNLSNSGGSNDLAFRLAHNWIPQLRPKVVVLFSPEAARSEAIDMDNITHQFGSWQQWQAISNDSYWSKFISNKINYNANKLKNQLAINYICDKLNIKLFVFDIMNISTQVSSTDLARDLTHMGVNTNKNIAEYILTNI